MKQCVYSLEKNTIELQTITTFYDSIYLNAFYAIKPFTTSVNLGNFSKYVPLSEISKYVLGITIILPSTETRRHS